MVFTLLLHLQRIVVEVVKEQVHVLFVLLLQQPWFLRHIRLLAHLKFYLESLFPMRVDNRLLGHLIFLLEFGLPELSMVGLISP